MLAGNVNQTSERLGRLYQEVEARTAELARSVGELQRHSAMSARRSIRRSISIRSCKRSWTKAVQLSETDAGTIYVFSSRQEDNSDHARQLWDERAVD